MAKYLLSAATALFAVALTIAACSAPPTPPKPAAAANTPSTPLLVSQQLWGDVKPVVSVKELMRDMIDPASDYVFDAIGSVTTEKGTVEREPKTQEDWDRVRMGGVMLAEGIYLLKVPRPWAPPGDLNNSTGPEPEELSPAQIQAKLEKDPVLWNAKIEALRNVGLQVIDIAKRKDKKELWDAGENLDQACEACHLEYWYPGDKALLKKLDERIRAMKDIPAPSK